MQLSLIDPRIHPVATKRMLDDAGLRDAIQFVRNVSGMKGDGWPYVEHVGDVEGRPAWAVDDDGVRYVVVRSTIFGPGDLRIANQDLRCASNEVFFRLDAAAREAAKW